tara:strand:+ start:1110 stop:1382 length:273 start_codon:yes stop_codon:yes gene_type:complete
MDKKDRDLFILITEEIQASIQDLVTRDPTSLATALLFAMCEIEARRKDYTPEASEKEPIGSFLQRATKEALALVDGVQLSKVSNKKEVLH